MASTRKELKCNTESILEMKTTTEVVRSTDTSEKKNDLEDGLGKERRLR